MVDNKSLNELPGERFIAEIRKVYADAIAWAKRDPEVSEKIITTFWDYIVTTNLWDSKFFHTLIGHRVEAINEVERAHKRIINSRKVDTYDVDMAITMALATIGMFHPEKPEVGNPHYDMIKQFNTSAADIIRFTYRSREMAISDVDEAEFTKKLNGIMHAFRIHQRDQPFVVLMDIFNVGSGAPLDDLFQRTNAAYVAINADMFPGLEGVQLGEAIVAKRCEALQYILHNLP